MANTDYTELFDLFMSSEVKDYNLDALYASSSTNLSTYLTGFLVLACSDFINCHQDLTNRNDTTMTFNIELTNKEKVILVDLMVRRWFIKEIQNITQFNNLLNTTDYKMYSNANSLKAKQDYLSVLNETVKQEMSEYGMQNIDWSAWSIGNFNI